MGLFKRAAKIVESHVEDAKEKAADKATTPEDRMQAAYLQMVNQVGDVKRQLGELEYAQSTLKQELADADAKLDALMKEAEAALAEGDEERARGRLARRKTVADRRADIAARLKSTQSGVDHLKDALEDMRDLVVKFRDERASLDVRLHTAQAEQAVARAQQAMSKSGTDALAKAAQQVREQEAMAEMHETIDQQLERLMREKGQ